MFHSALPEILASLLLFAWPGVAGDANAVSSAVVTPEERVVVLAGEYSATQTIEADRVIIPKGSVVRITGGATLTVRTKTLQIDGPALIDGSGLPGADRGDRWTSSGGESWGAVQCSVAHRDWEGAGSDVDVGGEGGPGSHFVLEYATFVGVAGGVDNLQHNMAGGRGGRGKELVCGCHRNEVKRGPSGRHGSDGTFRVTVTVADGSH